MTEKNYRPQEDIVALMTQFEQDVKDSPELPDAADATAAGAPGV